MSFVKKGLKKAWGFVKKYWKEIAMVAAVVFTAGVATVGFAAFSGVTSVGGFFSAVGSTMYAGVAGVAGSMGLGSGAVVPTNAATIAAGTAGTNVGFGAAAGLGEGFGLGKAGAESALAASQTAADSAAFVQSGGVNALLTDSATGATSATGVPVSGGSVVNPAGASSGAGSSGASRAASAAKRIAADAAKKSAGVGFNLDTAMKLGGAVGPALLALGQKVQPEYGMWGQSREKGKGYSGKGRNFLELGNASAGMDPSVQAPTPAGLMMQQNIDEASAKPGLMDNPQGQQNTAGPEWSWNTKGMDEFGNPIENEDDMYGYRYG